MRLRSNRASSGSEYHVSEKSDLNENPPDREEKPKVEYATSRSGRKIKARTYIESSDADREDFEAYEDSPAHFFSEANDKRVTRASKRLRHHSEDRDGNHRSTQYSLRSRRAHPQMQDFIEDEEEDDGEAPYGRSKKPKANGAPTANRNRRARQRQLPRHPSRITRGSSRPTIRAVSEDFQPQTSSPASADADGSTDILSDLDIQPEPEPEPEEEEPDDGKPYLLRQRQPVNYAIPPPLEDLPVPAQTAKRPGPHGRSGRSGHGASKRKGPGWSAGGAELGRWMGMPADDSVSDFFSRSLVNYQYRSYRTLTTQRGHLGNHLD